MTTSVKEEVKQEIEFSEIKKHNMISVHFKGTDLDDDSVDETVCGLWGADHQPERAKALAEHIVKTWNSYPELKKQNHELLEAAKMALDNLRNGESKSKYRYIEVVDALTNAISKSQDQ